MTTLPPPYTDPGNALPQPPVDAYAPAIADAEAARLIAVGQRAEARRETRQNVVAATAKLALVGALAFTNVYAFNQIIQDHETEVTISDDGKTKTQERESVPFTFASQTTLTKNGEFSKEPETIGITGVSTRGKWLGALTIGDGTLLAAGFRRSRAGRRA